MAIAGWRLRMFGYAYTKLAMYCLSDSLSPSKTLCNEVELATIGLHSVNLVENLMQKVSKESMEFLDKE